MYPTDCPFPTICPSCLPGLRGSRTNNTHHCRSSGFLRERDGHPFKKLGLQEPALKKQELPFPLCLFLSLKAQEVAVIFSCVSKIKVVGRRKGYLAGTHPEV